MKTIIINIALLLCIGSYNLSKAGYPVPFAAPPPASFSFQLFYDGLSPYGTWVNYPAYGYVWLPSASVGFLPYGSGGHWEYTYDYGWIWVSDYAWGWAPFHYGRWYFDDFYGWMWVPGYEWAPAWVTWGYYDTYYGWAPLGPGISFSIGYMPPAYSWCFVPRTQITSVNIINYRVQNTTIVQNKITVLNDTRSYNNATFASGPRVGDVEKATGKKIAPVSVGDAPNAGAYKTNNNKLTAYRPEISKAASAKAVPAKVEKLENMPHVKRSPDMNMKKESVPEKGAQKANPSKPANERAPEMKKNEMPHKQMERPEPKREPERKTEQPREKPQERTMPQEREKPRMDNPAPRHEPERKMESPREKQQMEQPQKHENPRMERPQQPEHQPRMERPPMEKREPPQQPRQQEPMPQREPMQMQPHGGGEGHGKPK